MIRLSELVAIAGGALAFDPYAETSHDAVVVAEAFPPDEAGASDITMIDEKSRLKRLPPVAAVITPTVDESVAIRQILVRNVHESFAKVVEKFRPSLDHAVIETGIDPTAEVDPTSVIHSTATIGAHVKIGPRCQVMPGATILSQTKIGADCMIGPNVTIYPYTRIGNRVSIHASSVLGARGFGYRRVDDQHIPMPQLGFVQIDEDVEIGASVTIDRGAYGATRIGQGTKIDNQVMIAHNCKIGKRNLLCSQVGIAGSCVTGDDVILAGQVGLKDHIRLGDGTIVGAQAGVMDDLEGNEVYLGSPATSQKDQMRIMAVERRLPQMRNEVKALRRELDELRRLTEIDRVNGSSEGQKKVA